MEHTSDAKHRKRHKKNEWQEIFNGKVVQESKSINKHNRSTTGINIDAELNISTTASTKKIEYVNVTLRFLCWKLVFPSGKRCFNVTDEQVAGIKAKLACTRLSYVNVIHFQRRVKQYQRFRAEIRTIEFSTWYESAKEKRKLLLAYSIGVLAILVISILMMCLFLSGAFTEEECLFWAGDVAAKIVLQVVIVNYSYVVLFLN